MRARCWNCGKGLPALNPPGLYYQVCEDCWQDILASLPPAPPPSTFDGGSFLTVEEMTERLNARAAARPLVLPPPVRWEISDTAPDCAPTISRTPIDAPANQERTLPMSTTPTGAGTTTGSNPAGVASQTPPENTGSPARTELRSVSTDENRREGREPTQPPSCFQCGPHPHVFPCAQCPDRTFLWCPIHGDHGAARHALTIEAHPRVTETYPEWKARVDKLRAQAVPEVSEGGTCCPDAVPPAVQRCTVIDGGAGDECGAIVGDDLHCDVCGGIRCYQHCRGLDHFNGRAVSRGGAGAIEWKVVEIAAGRFAGQIIRRPPVTGDLRDNEVQILSTINEGARLSEAEVLAELEAQVHVLISGGPAKPPLPEMPRAAGRWVPAPGVNDATDQLLEASRGKVSDKKRAELLLEVIEWLRAGETSWEVEIYAESWNTIDDLLAAAKKWHNRQIAELFSRLAGAL